MLADGNPSHETRDVATLLSKVCFGPKEKRTRLSGSEICFAFS